MNSWHKEVKEYFSKSKGLKLLGFDHGMVFWEEENGDRHGGSEEAIAKRMEEDYEIKYAKDNYKRS